MMKKNLVLAACVMLAACGKTPPAEAPQAATPAPVEAPAKPEPQAPVASPDQAQLMGGYVPQFAHRVRSQRHEDGKHVVIVEFIGLDASAVGAKLQEELAARRLTVKEPVKRPDGTVRYQAQNSKVGVLIADVNGSPALKLGPDAQGTIYFSWQDITKG